MSLLDQLLRGIADGALEIVDLTVPLSEGTPTIRLPAELGQPWPFAREVISEYDDAGPDVFWSNVSMSEHTGTHFDAPIHWYTGRGLSDTAAVPPRDLIRPAVVIDMAEEASDDPDFLLTQRHVEDWVRDYGPLPDRGWLLYRTGWSRYAGDPDRFLNDGRTPGVDPHCAEWLARSPIIGLGVETVGTDAGAAAGFDPPFPCHCFLQGAGKYGLTQLQNLARLPARGAVLLVGVLPIVRGSGSPVRALALIEHEAR